MVAEVAVSVCARAVEDPAVRAPGLAPHAVLLLGVEVAVRVDHGQDVPGTTQRDAGLANSASKSSIRRFVITEKAPTMTRLNLVKIRFSQNTFLIIFFTGRTFIMVKCNLKLVFEF